MLVIKGWTVFAHHLFLDQVDALIEKVKADKAKHPHEYHKKNAAKLLAAILRLAFDEIPANPADPAYRQGNTLGPENKHWFRAKFFQQFRLFYRFHESSKTIILAWVNDTSTKRAYGSSSDAYAVFRRMLKAGTPPNDWEALLKEAQESADRLTTLASADDKQP